MWRSHDEHFSHEIYQDYTVQDKITCYLSCLNAAECMLSPVCTNNKNPSPSDLVAYERWVCDEAGNKKVIVVVQCKYYVERGQKNEI